MKKLFVAIVAISIFASCKSTQSVTEKNISEQKKVVVSEQFIESNKWELVSFQDQKPEEVGFTHKTPTLVINLAENKIGGNSGCNSFGGEVIIEGNTIRFDKIFSTKMYCDGVPEHEFFQLLQQPLQYKIEEDVLKLLKDGSDILEFKKVSDSN